MIWLAKLESNQPPYHHGIVKTSCNVMPTLPTLEKLCDAFNISVSEFFSVVESAEREPIVLTHEQAIMLEKWSALRPEQRDLIVQLIDTML